MAHKTFLFLTIYKICQVEFDIRIQKIFIRH